MTLAHLWGLLHRVLGHLLSPVSGSCGQYNIQNIVLKTHVSQCYFPVPYPWWFHLPQNQGHGPWALRGWPLASPWFPSKTSTPSLTVVSAPEEPRGFAVQAPLLRLFFTWNDAPPHECSHFTCLTPYSLTFNPGMPSSWEVPPIPLPPVPLGLMQWQLTPSYTLRTSTNVSVSPVNCEPSEGRNRAPLSIFPLHCLQQGLASNRHSVHVC